MAQKFFQKIKSTKEPDKFDYMTIYFVGNNFNFGKFFIPIIIKKRV